MKNISKTLPVRSPGRNKTLVFSAINAKYPHTNLAVRLLMAEAEKTGIHALFTEHTIHTPHETIASDILALGADAAAFSCYIWNMPVIRSTIKQLKTVKPDILIILGGPEVSFDAESQLSRYPEIDYIISGEGEQAVKDLSRFLIDSCPLSECASLTYRMDNKIFSNPQNMDDAFLTAEFPYRDLAELNRRVVYYESTRGCPYACAFCLSGGRIPFREKPLDIVYRDLTRFIDAGVKIVKFVDRTFNANKSRTMAIIRFIMESAENTCFHLELSPQLLDDDLISLLASAESGRFQVEIGIQSTHLPTLKAINRKGDFEKFAPKIKQIITKRNIHVHVDLIAGLPFEGIREFRQSFDDVFSLYADNLQLGFLKLLKGSYLRAHADALAIQYDPSPPYEVRATPDLSNNDLNTLEEIEYLLKRFYNSGLYRLSIRFLSEKIGSAFECLMQLKAFINTAAIAIKHASESDLTEILWQFSKFSKFDDAAEIILFEALQKRKRPHLPPHIFEQERFDFKERYLKSSVNSLNNTKRILPVLFQTDVMTYSETGTLINRPSVVLFDYTDFHGGVQLSRGCYLP